MKKRFLPFSLLLVIMILGQSITIADNGGHYVPRTQGTASADRFMSELRANQHTGLIDPALMLNAVQNRNTRDASDDPLYWLSMGPDNMGGQTTAVLYDNRLNPNTGGTNGVVYIGSKGGGVYKSYNYGITWHQVGETDLMVSCMVQDADGVIYVGTGDGNSAATYNGLDQQGYDNSFVGGGVYKIVDDVVTALPSTVPSLNEVAGWSFVNDLALLGNNLLAGTDEGLMCSTDKGATWANVFEGKIDELKVAGDMLLVSAEGKLYMGTIGNLICHSGDGNSMQGDTLLPKAAALVDIAVAPSDPNTIYAAMIAANGTHSGIYVSYNKGDNWSVALPSLNNNYGHNVYSGYGLYNHGLVVDPNSNGTLYVLGYNLWRLQRPESGTGYFMTEQVTNGGATAYYEDSYLHVGLHSMVFNPNNTHECYVGTDGGIYKATVNNGTFSFSNCNRNYITTRMFDVAMSGKTERILAAGLDHGTVIIQGDENTNTLGYAEWINPTGYNYGAYDEVAQAGPCAISTINPNTIFVTYKSSGTPSAARSNTAGEDWISTNFIVSDSMSISSSSFRLPILLFENYNDANNLAMVKIRNTTGANLPAGTVVQCMSNCDYPFEHTLASTLLAGDSIEVHDPISARLYLGYTDAIKVTLTPLEFSQPCSWLTVADNSHSGFAGEPLSYGIAANGDQLWVGTKEGRLFRISNLNTVVDYGTGTITSDNFRVVTTEIELPTDGQCVTSIAVDPSNANKVIVTMGNYGNDMYVLYSTNALSEAPTFVSKQANLPKMPVYSSVIEMNTGHVILGTERGIYRAKDINYPNWVADSKMLGEVPVMELKQQLLYEDDKYVVLVNNEDTIINVYPGVKNTGIVYAATYGKGIYRCENYKVHTGYDVPETPATVTETSVNIYPNPVSSFAKVSFEAKGNANVSYQVYDLTGRLVMNQNLGRLTEGAHEIEVNASNLSAGSYILRLTEGTRSSSVKFLVY